MEIAEIDEWRITMMNEIHEWFENLKNEKSDWEIVIDKIMEGLSEKGFDNSSLDDWIDSELNEIKEKNKSDYAQVEDNEN